MVSTSQVLEMLVSKGFATEAKMVSRKAYGLSYKSPSVKGGKVSVSDETYGKKSMLYFRAPDTETARKIAHEIEQLGGKPNFSWCGDDSRCFELQVSPFKGWHHWE